MNTSAAARWRVAAVDALREVYDATFTLDPCVPDARRSDYRLTAVAGDPLTLYLAVLDRPRPHGVALVDGTLIITSGAPAYEPPFTAADVYDTDPETWATLLDQPFPSL
jgi:hypothetical protein